MIWYMSVDKNNKPNGWDNSPWGTAIEVSQAVRDIHEVNPDYIWNGTTLVAPPVPPPVPPPYVPTPQELILQQIAALESSVTTRMIRESIIGKQAVNPHTGKTAKQQIEDIDTQIEVLRGQLNG